MRQKRFRLRGLAATALALAGGATAQAADVNPLLAAVGAPDDLTLKASVRVRSESIGGDFRAGTPTQFSFWSLRTDVFAEYHPGWFRIGGEFRDARGWSERRDFVVGTSEINTLEPLQAYIGVTVPGVGGSGGSVALTGGRFTMDLGAGRLVARPDFPNSVVDFTGASLDWRSRGGDRLFAFWTLPSMRLPSQIEDLRDNRGRFDQVSTALQFYGADLTKTHLPADLSLEAYLFKLAEDDSPGQETRNRQLLTYGGRLFRPARTGRFDLELEVAHQTGHERATAAVTDRTDLPVQAWLVHGEVGRKFPVAWTPRVSLHADLATGDDADPRRITRFDGLFGATRVDWGPTGLYGAINRSNVRSVGIRLDTAPSKRIDAFAMVRSLWLDSPTDSFANTGVRDRSGRSGTNAGAQLEARLRYWLVPKVLHTDIGGAVLAKGRFLSAAPNAPNDGSTRYLFVDLQVDL